MSPNCILKNFDHTVKGAYTHSFGSPVSFSIWSISYQISYQYHIKINMITVNFLRKRKIQWQLVAYKNILWWFLSCLTVLNNKEMVLVLLEEMYPPHSAKWEVLWSHRQVPVLVPPVAQGASPHPTTALQVLGRGLARGLWGKPEVFRIPRPDQKPQTGIV